MTSSVATSTGEKTIFHSDSPGVHASSTATDCTAIATKSTELFHAHLPSKISSSSGKTRETFLSSYVVGDILPSHLRTITEPSLITDYLDPCRTALISKYQGKELDLLAPDGIKINAMHFPGTTKKAILFLHGNGGFYENTAGIPLEIRDQLHENIHIMVFNPRGTGKSEGNPTGPDLPLDVYSAFQYLVEHEGIDPSDIVIFGHSMGGFIGALGAELIQRVYPEKSIHLVSDRSFSSIAFRMQAIVERKMRASSFRFFTGIVQSIAPYILRYCEWDRDPLAALSSLKGRVCVIYHKLDPIIDYPISLHCALKEHHLSGHDPFTSIRLQEAGESVPEMKITIKGNPHTRGYTEEEKILVMNELRKMLNITSS